MFSALNACIQCYRPDRSTADSEKPIICVRVRRLKNGTYATPMNVGRSAAASHLASNPRGSSGSAGVALHGEMRAPCLFPVREYRVRVLLGSLAAGVFKEERFLL